MEGRAQVTSAMDPVACPVGTQHLSPGHRQGESSPIKGDHCMVHSAHDQTGAKEGRLICHINSCDCLKMKVDVRFE